MINTQWTMNDGYEVTSRDYNYQLKAKIADALTAVKRLDSWLHDRLAAFRVAEGERQEIGT